MPVVEDRTAAGTPRRPNLPHTVREADICARCGHCDHELTLNGACYFGGTTDLDPIALSPKKPVVIPPDQLIRPRPLALVGDERLRQLQLARLDRSAVQHNLLYRPPTWSEIRARYPDEWIALMEIA